MKNKKYTIATLGSHSALQILKGAKDEGFATLLYATGDRSDFYKRFKFIDKVITLPSLSTVTAIEKSLKNKSVIIIPHGSFVAYLEKESENNLPYFGNKAILDWEADRSKQRLWMQKSGVNVPRQFHNINEIDYPVIVKTYGAAGGKGYFYAKNYRDFQSKIKSLNSKNYVIQEYIIGVTLFIHYFYSPLTNQIEVMSIDRRYETNVDSLGRIPLVGQQGLAIEPSYVVVGNSPLVLRESMLPTAYKMGEQVVSTSKKLINKHGLYGPFCLETVITPDQKFYVIEISCRIVGGSNLFINGSPYSWLNYDEPMSTGRRIAREIKMAIRKGKLDIVLDK